MNGINKDVSDSSNKEVSNDTNVSTSKEESADFQLGVYGRRWIVLFIGCGSIFLRGFNQSCYGPINSVFVLFLNVQPWQVDWFILTQSVVFLSMSFPLSLITSRIGFRNTYLVMTICLLIGFALTTVGVTLRTGYVSIIVGQAIMGLSNIISWSIPPPTAAIWFPSNEVAISVALQVVGRGVGESVGSILTPELVNVHQDMDTIAYRLMWIFITFTIIAALLTVAAYFFVRDAPPLPPSEAQAKAILAKAKSGNMQTSSFSDTLIQYRDVVKHLFTDRYFIAIWFVFGAINPVLRNNSVLLSSILHSSFVQHSALNVKAGYVLMGGWITYTIGGFIAGPIISKTKKFKRIVLASVALECVASIVIMLGIRFRLLICVYVGVVSLGLFLGMANTSLFELLVEVTYPNPTMLVTMVNIVGMGIFRLIYPIIGRVLLTDVGPTASTAFPVAMTFIATVVLAMINPPYKRQIAEEGETEKLLKN